MTKNTPKDDAAPDLFGTWGQLAASDAAENDAETPKIERPSAASNIASIPATQPFLKTFVTAVLAGDLPHAGAGRPDPLALSRMTLLFPSRRAVRAAEDEFLRQTGGALLLPRIRAVSDVDEAGLLAHGLLDPLPPAVPELERHLILTDFVRKWSKTMHDASKQAGPMEPVFQEATPAQAAALASELMELMDTAETEEADLSGLGALVREDFADHWQKTLDFLEIITQQWPVYLETVGTMSKVLRLSMLIRAQAAHFVAAGLDAGTAQPPVIIAGEIGGVAATADLMRAIADLPHGAVVLPGLDFALDEDSYNAVVPAHPEHPQYGLKELLDSLGVARADVREVGGARDDSSHSHLKNTVISEMMRPAATTDKWADLAVRIPPAGLKELLHNITSLSAKQPEEEAEVVALILRRTAATKGQTAALVTPDRALARRVRVRLAKWGLGVDDSGGAPLPSTPIGAFYDHVIEVLHSDFAPASFLTLLKHPYLTLGLPAAKVRAAARALELAALRQPRIGDGLYAIKRGLAKASYRFEQKNAPDTSDGDSGEGGGFLHPAVRRLKEEDYAAAGEILERVEERFAPLLEAFKTHKLMPFKDIVEAHKAVVDGLGAKAPKSSEPKSSEAAAEAGPADDAAAHLYKDDMGQAMGRFIDTLRDEEIAGTSLSARDYAGLYRSLVSGEVVRSGKNTHDRLFIWGPMEARLQTADIVILGGLNEGTWPQAADTDAWLSRPMRETLGLSQPERRIGRSAHDFCQAFGAGKIYLTRSEKIDGVPMVPSRWLLRLIALVDGAGLDGALAPAVDEPWLDWAEARDQAENIPSAPRPAPTPPVEVRPRKLSVSSVKDWIANPYAVFAKSIMKLQPLPDLGEDPDAAMRGQMVHGALHEFSKLNPDELPDTTAGDLVAFADRWLRDFEDHPRVLAFWKPRFARFAQWFAETEPERREGLAQHLSEIEGEIDFDAPAGAFTLTARADRVDLAKIGHVAIYDYKTGNPPDKKSVMMLKEPQLPLEAKIAMAGGFSGLEAVEVSKLSFIKASGDELSGAQEDRDQGKAAELAEGAYDGLVALAAAFDDESQPYTALRRSDFNYTYDDFEHLARVKEWAVEDDGGAS